jgi:hypothetical protein
VRARCSINRWRRGAQPTHQPHRPRARDGARAERGERGPRATTTRSTCAHGRAWRVRKIQSWERFPSPGPPAPRGRGDISPGGPGASPRLLGGRPIYIYIINQYMCDARSHGARVSHHAPWSHADMCTTHTHYTRRKSRSHTCAQPLSRSRLGRGVRCARTRCRDSHAI